MTGCITCCAWASTVRRGAAQMAVLLYEQRSAHSVQQTDTEFKLDAPGSETVCSVVILLQACHLLHGVNRRASCLNKDLRTGACCRGHLVLRACGTPAAGVSRSSRQPGERVQGCCTPGHCHPALPAGPAQPWAASHSSSNGMPEGHLEAVSVTEVPINEMQLVRMALQSADFTWPCHTVSVVLLAGQAHLALAAL